MILSSKIAPGINTFYKSLKKTSGSGKKCRNSVKKVAECRSGMFWLKLTTAYGRRQRNVFTIHSVNELTAADSVLVQYITDKSSGVKDCEHEFMHTTLTHSQ